MDDEDCERDCPKSWRLSGAERSCSWDSASSEDSEMMGESVEKPGPARGEERHGRVYITTFGGATGRAVRVCDRTRQ